MAGQQSAQTQVAKFDVTTLGGVLSKLDASLTTDKLAGLLKGAGADEARAVQNVFRQLGKILLGQDSSVSESELPALLKSFDAAIAGGASGNIVVLSGLASDKLVGMANDDIGVRYALMNGLPFAISGNPSLYDNLNRDGSLFRFDPNTGERTYTDEWLKDRSQFMSLKAGAGGDGNIAVSGSQSWVFEERNADGATRINANADQAQRAPNKMIFATATTDTQNIVGGSGADHVYSGGGDDLINAGAGDDYVEAGAGDDTINAGGGADQVTGNGGNDVLHGGTGADSLFGNEGDDHLFGENGNDSLNGGGGADFLNGGAGADALDGGQGNDSLEGGAGADSIADRLGSNMFSGQAGNDTMTGGDDGNVFIGGTGRDSIQSGSGNDLFAFNAGDGNDSLQLGGGRDTLSLGGGIRYEDLAFQRSGSDLKLFTGGGDSITLTDWYGTGAQQSLVSLQVIADALGDFNPGGSDTLRDNRVEEFDFQMLVSKFEQAKASNPKLNRWNLMNSLLSAHMGESDIAALGGDLAYQFGHYGSLANVSVDSAQSVLASAQLNVDPQQLQSIAQLQTGGQRLS